tara:strand:+ start:343 stop:792 length:450 start_codon:yes stop_codon:yes gene_type:complete
MSQISADTIKGVTAANNITLGNTPIVSASANSLTIRGEGSAQTSVQQGLCKSWVFFDGSESPLTNNDSFNVSSLVDNGTGNYDKVFTNNMNSGNFSVSGTGADIIPISNNRDRNFEAVAENTTQVNINFFLSSQQDMNFVSCQSFGDLA